MPEFFRKIRGVTSIIYDVPDEIWITEAQSKIFIGDYLEIMDEITGHPVTVAVKIKPIKSHE
jgi:hypothetical protein